MDGQEFLTARFDGHRDRLAALARRMLGSAEGAEAALREARRRLAGPGGEQQLADWLAMLVGRACVDALRERRGAGGRARRGAGAGAGAGAVGPALLVVLESLEPAQRLALVLRDLYAVPFEEIARLLGHGPEDVWLMVELAHRRIRAGAPPRDLDPAARGRVVEAFLAAAREGDPDALHGVLAPDVVARSDDGSAVVRGADAVVPAAASFARTARIARPVLAEGGADVVAGEGRQRRVMAFGIVNEMIVEIEVVTDPARLERMELAPPG
ncbi:MAG: RNA polymerase subunit sigma-70 [Kitasatospora sp.]|jgi:RNA polymerase sigma-70 factor (ECF subfamily)|nr:RNA polymerase subunit sigma-70 [Kitasatospora sp.]